jgi:osmoprotectant transport system ATP-binding protein
MVTPRDGAVNRNCGEIARIPDMAETIIEFRNTEYYRSALSRAVLAGISLKIYRGETIALLGRSGSGKTTLLKLINRLLCSTSGEVLVQGRLLRDWDPIRLRRSIGYVIQDVGLFPHLTVQENVAVVPSLEKWPAGKIQDRYREVMALVGLPHQEYAQRYPREVSGGQRQRIGVARALAADPAILLMDEPFGALDPVTRAELQRECLQLTRRVSKTIVLVTHDVREALLLGTRVILLDQGRIAADAPPAEFVRTANPLIREFIAAAEISGGATA